MAPKQKGRGRGHVRKPRRPGHVGGVRNVDAFEAARAFAIENPDVPMAEIARRFGFSVGSLWQSFRDTGVVATRNSMRSAMVEEAAIALARRLGEAAGERLAELSEQLAEVRRGLLSRVLQAAIGEASDPARLAENEVTRTTGEDDPFGAGPGDGAATSTSSAKYKSPHLDIRFIEAILKHELHVTEIMAGLRRSADVEYRVRTALGGSADDNVVPGSPASIPSVAGAVDPGDELRRARAAALETFGIMPGPNGTTIVKPPGFNPKKPPAADMAIDVEATEDPAEE